VSDDADLVIVGAGPCGLAAAISAQRAGLKPLVIESQVAVSTIAAYPAYVRFFSTAEKLAIGELPFVIATEKPSRRDALAYYRAVVLHFAVPLRQREPLLPPLRRSLLRLSPLRREREHVKREKRKKPFAPFNAKQCCRITTANLLHRRKLRDTQFSANWPRMTVLRPALRPSGPALSLLSR